MAIIYSTGFQQSITNDGLNSKPLINEIQWDADYKNNQGKMNVNINKNGKKNKYQVKLNKNDLENILKMPTVNQSLDQRLAHDFAILHSPSITSKSNINSNINSNLNPILQNNDYSEIEKLFTLRKKLLTPYHVTHKDTKNKSNKANKANKSNKANKKNKAKGTRKNSSFFSKFTNML